MTSYIKAASNYFLGGPQEASPPTNADPASGKTKEAVQKGRLSFFSSLLPSLSASKEVFANAQEEQAALILRSSYPDYDRLSSLFSIFESIMKNKSVSKEQIETIVKIISSFRVKGNSVLEGAFAQLLPNLVSALESEIPLSMNLFRDTHKALSQIFEYIKPSFEYLVTVLKPYAERNECVNYAYLLICKKIEQKNYLYSFEEMTVLANAFQQLHRKECPSDYFIAATHNFFTVNPQTARLNASREIWELLAELKAMPTDDEIREKLMPYQPDDFLPPQTEAYLKELKQCGLFERFQNLREQSLELEDLRELLDQFSQGNPNISKHALFVSLDRVQQFLYNPAQLPKVTQSKAEQRDTGKAPAQPQPEKPSSENMWDRVKSTVNGAFEEGESRVRKLFDEGEKRVKTLFNEGEERAQKLLAPIHSTLGIETDPEKGTLCSYPEVVQIANLLQEIATHQESDEQEITPKIQTAVLQLERLINDPQTLIKRPWKNEEISSLTQLRNSLVPLVNQNGPFVISEQVKTEIRTVLDTTLAPFTQSVLQNLLSTLSNAAAQLATLSASKAGSALSHQLGSEIALGVRVMLEGCKEQLKHNKHYAPIIQAIERVLPVAENIEKDGSFGQLASLLQSCLNEVRRLPPIYVNNIPLFFNIGKHQKSSSPFSPYADGIAKNQRALRNRESEAVNNTNFQAQTDANKDKFAENTTNLFLISTIHETICGVVPRDNAFYTNLLDKSRINGENNAELLRENFFSEIDKLYSDGNITIIHKWISKISYFLMMPIVKSIMNKLATKFIAHIREIIIKRDKDGFAKLQHQALRNLNTFLGGLGDAYKNVLKNPSVKGSLLDKMEAELAKPEYNKGLSEAELYKEVTQQAIKTFLFEFELIPQFSELMKDRLIDSPIRPAVMAMGSLTFFVLRLILVIPMKIFNALISWRLKPLIVNNQLLQVFVEKNLSSLTNNNDYVHALNCVVADQLKEIKNALHHNYNHKIPQAPLKDARDLKANHQKKELTRAVTLLLENLAKSKCYSDDQLDKLMNNKSIMQKLQEMVDGFFIPDAVDSIVKVINTVYDTIFEENQLEKHLSNFSSLVNEAFTKGQKVDEEAFQQKAAEVNSLINEILQLTIKEALDKVFSSSIEVKKDKLNTYTQKLKTDIGTLSENFEKSKIALLKEKIQQQDPTESISLIKELLRVSDTFKTNQGNDLLVATGDKELDTYITDFFRDLSAICAKHVDEIDERLRQLLTIQEHKAIFSPRNRSSSEMQILQEIERCVDAMDQWTQSEDFNKIDLIDFSFSELKTVKDYIAKIADARIQEQVDGLVNFFEDPLNYKGILHHMIFLPFIAERLKKMQASKKP